MKKIFTAIFGAIGFLILFFATAFVGVVILTLSFDTISKIPILNVLMDLMFAIREDSPGMVTTLTSYMIAYMIVKAVSQKITDISARKAALVLTGIGVIAIDIVVMVVASGIQWANLVIFGTAIAFFVLAGTHEN